MFFEGLANVVKNIMNQFEKIIKISVYKIILRCWHLIKMPYFGFLAHLWGAYAVALSGARCPSYIVCRLCPP